MELSHCIYYSVAQFPPKGREFRDALSDIITSSVTNNARLGLTGALVYDRGFFMQWLEGQRLFLNEIMRNIMVDDRHRDVTIVSFKPLKKRVFPNWSMALVDPTWDGVNNFNLSQAEKHTAEEMENWLKLVAEKHAHIKTPTKPD